MGQINTSTSAISSPTTQQRLSLAFSKKVLTRLENQNPEPFLQFATEHPIMQRQGRKIIVTLTSALGTATTPLSDGGQAAKSTAFTTTNIALTLDFYGNDIGWSTLFDLTANDIAKETHSTELAMNARESVTQLMVDQIDAETPTHLGASLAFASIVQIVRTLGVNKVRRFDELGGCYVGCIGNYGFEDLMTEASAAYKDHYQTPKGSDIMAEGQLSKPAAGVQFFITNYNKVASSRESEYVWGKDALVKTELKNSVAGANGKAIGGIDVATLTGYLVMATADNSDLYGLDNHAVWRAGPLAVAVADSNRIFVGTITT